MLLYTPRKFDKWDSTTTCILYRGKFERPASEDMKLMMMNK